MEALYAEGEYLEENDYPTSPDLFDDETFNESVDEIISRTSSLIVSQVNSENDSRLRPAFSGHISGVESSIVSSKHASPGISSCDLPIPHLTPNTSQVSPDHLCLSSNSNLSLSHTSIRHRPARPLDWKKNKRRIARNSGLPYTSVR